MAVEERTGESANPPSFTIQQWSEDHPRWPEFIQCLQDAAPEQSPFVVGEYARHLPCHLLVALQADRIVGFLRFGIQPIGSEAGCPPLVLNGAPLTEAKIHAFAVREECRGQGIGTALQRCAIERSRELGCHQLASHSSYDREANVHVKLSLGFSAQPDDNGDPRGIRFLMPLRGSA